MEHDMTALNQHLQHLYETEEKIAGMIRKCGLRCSPNKLVADLGEFYAYQGLLKRKDLFRSIEPQEYSNSDHDMTAILSEGSDLYDLFQKERLRIEVKTRRNQKGAKYLSGVKPEKFDLLCMVDMKQNYLLSSIFLVTSSIADENLDRKRGRLIFREHMAIMELH